MLWDICAEGGDGGNPDFFEYCFAEEVVAPFTQQDTLFPYGAGIQTYSKVVEVAPGFLFSGC